jgi:hypothetical protein
MNAQEQKEATLKIELEFFKQYQSEIEQKQKALHLFASQIVESHCPYKSGARVLYAEFWQKNKQNTGVVIEKSRLSLDGSGIDGLWRVVVQPTRKDGRWHLGRHPVHLGHHKDDQLTLIDASSDSSTSAL